MIIHVFPPIAHFLKSISATTSEAAATPTNERKSHLFINRKKKIFENIIAFYLNLQDLGSFLFS
jgi:hypothetical protein